MMTLIARGPDRQRLQWQIEPYQERVLGRAEVGDAAVDQPELLAVPWDLMISRQHVRLRHQGESLQVRRLESARNPIFYQGEPRTEFAMKPGDHFVIGDTTFRLNQHLLELVERDETPVDIVGYTLEDLRQTRFRDADERLEVLSNIPHVIRGASNDVDLFSRLMLLLLEGLPMADAVAVVRVADGGEGGQPAILILAWESRDPAISELQPSRRLILEAVVERRQSVRCLWSKGGQDLSYTVTDNLDWAFCTPVPGDACKGWGLYATGHALAGEPQDIDLRPDLKFTELVAAALGALRDVQLLDSRQAALSRFFSPRALPLLSGTEGEHALQPRQADVAVLFCDLRGFSREAEQSRDELLAFLGRVGLALDIMTESIHDHQGVVGDFQGDAALAFWGWPLDQPQSAAAACRAALEIRDRFAQVAQQPDHPLANFRYGIGIASGTAVAGRIGSTGRFKIGVFGPVVNLASRLESITKRLRAPILADEHTVAEVVRQDHADIRFRRLATIRPQGMGQAATISEVLPAYDRQEQSLTDEDILGYEAALEAFNAGRWDEALALLHQVPHWDHGKDFLMSHILLHQRQPPEPWDGVIDLIGK